MAFCGIHPAANSFPDASFFAPEICNNNIDDDGDGLLDCLDPDCQDSEFCDLAKELPFPPINLNLFPAGTLLIPMDDAHQNIGAAFNLKAYGAIVYILNDYIPVKWIIRTGKQKTRISATLHDLTDGIDVTTDVEEALPTPSSTTTTESFRSGLFAISIPDTARAMAVINDFNALHSGSEVRVYRMTDTATMDVRYTLNIPPNVGILNDGGNKGIHIPKFEAAGLIDGVHFHSTDADGNDILLLSTVDEKACYTMLTEPHTNQSLVVSVHLDNIIDYLNSGGNFFAQCHAVQAYETETPPIETYTGQLLSTLGLEVTNEASTPFYYPNADLPYNQFTGDLDATGGSGHDWLPATDPAGDGIDSDWQNNTHPSVINNDDGDGLQEFRAFSGKLKPDEVGSNIFYLGGHDFGLSTSNLEVINGSRMMLNAMLVPAVRPVVCNPLPEYCMAIAEDSSGRLYFWDTLGVYAEIGTLGANSVESMSFDFSGQEMIAFDDDGYGLVDTSNGVYANCRNLGTANGVLGGINISEVDGLTVDQNTGYLIGIESRAGVDIFFMIDVFDCDIVKDFFGKGISYLPISGASQNIQDIAVNPQDGLIYAISSASGAAVDTIVTIDRGTGVATFVVTTDECDLKGLTFNNKGQLFGSTGTSSCNLDNTIYRIDLVTGLTTIMATLPHNEIAALTCYNFVPEICGNGRDEDADGLIDCADPDCLCESCDENQITGYVFYDLNQDTIYNGADLPQAGVNVQLYWDLTKDTIINAGDLLVASNTTLADGSYSFTRDYQTPNIVESIVAQSTDDAKDGDTNDSVLKLGKDKWAGIRFHDVSIPYSAILNCAYIEFNSARKKDKNTSSVRIFAHDIADSPTFTDAGNDVSSRTTTTTFLDWTFGDWAGGGHYQSDDIAPIIEELITSYGTLANSNISFLLESTGTQEREAFTYDQGAPFAPRLVLYYTEKDGGESFIVTIDQSTLPTNTILTTDSTETAFFQSGGNIDSLNNFGFYLLEDCGNGIDDDNDGDIDCDDAECSLTISNTYSCASDKSITLTASGGGGGPYSYDWSDWVDPEAYWTFEDTTLDVSGNLHHEQLLSRVGTPIFDADAAQGRSSLSLDGATYLRYSEDGGFMESTLTKWAVSFWLNPSTLSGIQYIFEEGDNTNGLALRLNGNALEFATRNAGVQANSGTLVFPSDGLWHHITATYESDSIRIYLDGVASTAAYTGYPLGKISAHTGNGGIGQQDSTSSFGGGTGNFFSGLIDDFQYFFNVFPDIEHIRSLAANDGSRQNIKKADYYYVTATSAAGCTVMDTVAFRCARTITTNLFIPLKVKNR